jgi:PIN domain nuclease of toxin-antitoxin system
MNRLLLDTHVLLWWHEDNPMLTAKGRALICNTADVYVSIVSLWEMAIKFSAGKLKFDISHSMTEALADFRLLDLSVQHIETSVHLPWRHRDPFDRMLIAQAKAEGLTIVTNDRCIAQYDVKHISC